MDTNSPAAQPNIAMPSWLAFWYAVMTGSAVMGWWHYDDFNTTVSLGGAVTSFAIMFFAGVDSDEESRENIMRLSVKAGRFCIKFAFASTVLAILRVYM